MKDNLKLEKDVIYVSPKDNLQDVLVAFRYFKISHVPVVSSGKLVGLISKSDITNYLLSLNLEEESVNKIIKQTTADQLMTRNVVTIKHNETLDNIAQTFIDKKIGSVVVVFEEKIIGIVTEKDMIALLKEYADYNQSKGLGIVDRIKNIVYEGQGHTIAKALSDIGV